MSGARARIARAANSSPRAQAATNCSSSVGASSIPASRSRDTTASRSRCFACLRRWDRSGDAGS
jgi:hypothetical protein